MIDLFLTKPSVIKGIVVKGLSISIGAAYFTIWVDSAVWNDLETWNDRIQ